MGRLGRVARCVLLMLLVSSGGCRHAVAGGGWFERLSGPGPFGGFDFDFRQCLDSREKRLEKVIEFLEKNGGSQAEIDRLTGMLEAGRQPPDQLGTTTAGGGGAASWNCSRSRNRFRLSPAAFSTNVGMFWSSKNNMTYGPEVAGSDKVKAVKIVEGFDLALHEVLDVGIGTGVVIFWGERFDPLTKWLIQPIRLTFFPLTPFGEDDRLELLYVRISGNVMPFGFKDTDFGAIPGTFDVGAEWLWDITVSLDVTKFKKAKAP